MSRPRRCRHVCACGAVLVCGDADRCAAGARWVCPTCDLAAFDAYLQAQMAEHPRQEHAQETRTHAESI